MSILTASATPDPEPERHDSIAAALDDLADGPLFAAVADLQDGPLFAAIRNLTGEPR